MAFEGKVIVVTGASEGIGRALCLSLAPRKPKLVVAARNEKRLMQLKEEAEALGAEVLVAPTDVTHEEACKDLIEKPIGTWGCLDILVNNAGGTMWSTLEEIKDISLFERMMRLNYLSSVYCTYHALPYLKKSRGRVLVVSAMSGLTGVPTRTAYSASKHAMFGFFDSLRIELEGTGITITMVAPDFVLSQVHNRALDGYGKPLGKSPMQKKKIMTSAECASIIVNAMEDRRRLVFTSFRGRLSYWLKPIAPGLVDGLWGRAIRKKK